MRPAHVSKILDREFISASEGQHTPVMVWGAPGVGKSQMVAQVASRHGVPLIDIRLSQIEPSDLRGIPFRVNDHVEWAAPAMLPREDRHGTTGILFLDEINTAPPAVSAAAYQLILDRRLGDYVMPEGWAIFAAGNRQGDRGVTYTMPAPLANRFSHFEVETYLDDWVSWAYVQGIDERLIAFLRFRPDLLFDFDPSHTAMAFPSPRSWEFAHRALAKFGDTPDLLLDALQACVGKAAGVELQAYLNNLAQMPDVEAILAGDEVLPPESIDLQYAVAAALIGRAKALSDDASGRQGLGNIIRYADGLSQREMGVMLISDLHRALGERLFEVPEFDQWAERVADVMLFQG